MEPKSKTTVRLLTNASDQMVWQALKEMQRVGVPFNPQPRPREISKFVVQLGFEAMTNKAISAALKHLEKIGWIRRPLELIAA